jgi:hypothetical protein
MKSENASKSHQITNREHEKRNCMKITNGEDKTEEDD